MGDTKSATLFICLLSTILIYKNNFKSPNNYMLQTLVKKISVFAWSSENKSVYCKYKI